MNLILDEIKEASIVFRDKFPFVHQGLLLNDGQIAHISPRSETIVTSLEEFAAGKTVYLQLPKPVTEGVDQRLAKLQENKEPYSALSNNCEDTVTFLKTGLKSSKTRQRVLTTSAIGGAFALTQRNNAVKGALIGGTIGLLFSYCVQMDSGKVFSG